VQTHIVGIKARDAILRSIIPLCMKTKRKNSFTRKTSFYCKRINSKNYCENMINKKKLILIKKGGKNMASVSSVIMKKTYYVEILSILINKKIKNNFDSIDIIKNTILIVKNPENTYESGIKKKRYTFALVTNNPDKCGFVNAIFLDNMIDIR